ncbi:MAG TPA: DNA-directed RNA polymerase subunit beta [Pseudogracilibacillus sp.]|nr:DNA-directed RNA polymerase subunit beta [Pseudogracilibacillus sp.]
MVAKPSNGKEIRQSNKQNDATNERTQPPRKKRTKNKRVRLIPIWLRIIIVLVLAVVALAFGLMFGYGVIGDGNPTDVFQKETWQHIIDIVTKEE